MTSKSEQYHFEVSVIDDDEALDEIVCGLNIFDLKREIQQKVIPNSKYYLPLEIGTIGWNLCFEVSKNKHIVIKSNDELRNAVFENSTKRNFKLLIKFKDEQKYNQWKEQQLQMTMKNNNNTNNHNLGKSTRKYTVSTPGIQRIESYNGYFKCYVQYPTDIITKIQYVIQYQIKRVAAYKISRSTRDKIDQHRRSKITQKKPTVHRIENDVKDDYKEEKKSNHNNNANNHENKQSQSQSQSQQRHKRSSREQHIYQADSAPFIIRHHIWPNQKYKFRVRLVSKLFSSQKSNWTEWSERYIALPPTINSLISNENIDRPSIIANNNNNNNDNSLTIDQFENYNHDDLCKWIYTNLYKHKNNKNNIITFTKYEEKELFDIFFNCIKQSKLTGNEFISQKPEKYIESLLKIYYDTDEKKIEIQRQGTSDDMNIDSKNSKNSGNLKPFMPKSRSYSKYSPDYLDRKLQQKKVQILNLLKTNSMKNKKLPKIENYQKIDDKDFIFLLKDVEVEKLLQQNGIDHKSLIQKVENKINRQREKEEKKSKNGTTKSFGRHDFLSILYRLKQLLYFNLSLPICSNPYCIYIWSFFHKEPSKLNKRYSLRPANTDEQQNMLQLGDYHEVTLKPGLSIAECTLYFGYYYLRQYSNWTNLMFNLYENGSLLFIDNEQIIINNNKIPHIIIQCLNNESEKNTESMEKCRQLKDWKDGKDLFINKKMSASTILNSKNNINLPFFDNMMKFLFKFVGKLISFNDAIYVFTILWKHHQQKIKNKQDLHSLLNEYILKYKFKSEIFQLNQVNKYFNENNVEFINDKYLKLTQILFEIYWISGSNVLIEKSNLFDHRMINIDIIQILLNKHIYGNIERMKYLFESLYSDNLQNDEISFIDRIIASIQLTSKININKQHQFILWYNFIDCFVKKGKAKRFPLIMNNNDQIPTTIHDANKFKFNVDSLFLRLIMIDCSIEKLTSIKRCIKMEKQGFFIISQCLLLSESNPVHCQDCFHKMNGILSIFKPNYSSIMISNRGKLDLILNQQKYPFHAMLSMYKILKPTHTNDLIVFAEYMSRFVDQFNPSNKPGSSQHIVKYFHNILCEDHIIAKNEILLNAILNNDSLCWRGEFIPFILPILSSKSKTNKKLYQRLKKIYLFYWINHGLLSTINELIVKNKLLKDPLIDLIKEQKETKQTNLIINIPFKEWLEIISHRSSTTEMALILVLYPPLKFNKMRKLDYTLLINTLVGFDYKQYPNSNKPLIHYKKYNIANNMVKNIMGLKTQFYNCHDHNFNNITEQDIHCETIKFFSSTYGSNCIKFCYQILSFPGSEHVEYCNKLFSNFKQWWQSLRINFANAHLNDSLISILEKDCYDKISDLFNSIGGETSFHLDDKIRKVIEQYQNKKKISLSLNLFFNHFVPPDTLNWAYSLKELHKKWLYLESLTPENMLKETWSWYTPYKLFLDKLTKYPESFVFKQLWKDRFSYYKIKWDNDNGIKFDDMDHLDCCLWLDSFDITNKQFLKPIEELQKHFITKGVNGKHLHQVKLYQNPDIVQEFCKRIQLKLNLNKYNKQILEKLLFPIKKNAMNQQQQQNENMIKNDFCWNKLYSMNILKLLFETDVEPFWNEMICKAIKENNIRVYYIERYFNLNHNDNNLANNDNIDQRMIFKEIKYMKIFRNDEQIQEKTIEIVKCLENVTILKKVKLIHQVLGIFKKILVNKLKGPEKEWQILTQQLSKLYFPLNENEPLQFNFLLNFVHENEKHLKNINLTNEAIQFLTLLKENEQFVAELFEHFSDDQKFANHIKLFQNPDPEHQQSLLNLHNIRKLLIKDIAQKIDGYLMFQARDFLVNNILKYIKTKAIKQIEDLINDWVDIKGDVSALASLQFNRDRSYLQRLQAFKYKKAELIIELKQREITQDDEEKDQQEADDNNNAEEKKENDQDKTTTFKRTNSMRGRKLTFLTHSIGNMNDNNNPNIMSVEEFESLHDRLLIYTSSTNTTALPHLMKKEMKEWTNNDVMEFFQNELNSTAKTIIDDNECEIISKILKKRNITGQDLYQHNNAFKQFSNLLLPHDNDNDDEDIIKFESNETRKEIVLMELLKIVQIQAMKSKVNEIVPKFDIAKQIQKLRRMYFEQGGEDLNTKFNVIEIFNDSKSNFEQILIRWKFYLYEWRNAITNLRQEYPLLCYFTVNDMRFICYEYTQYKGVGGGWLAKAAKLPKLTAKFAFIDRKINDTTTEKIIKEWSSLKDDLYSNELKKLLKDKFNKKLKFANLQKLLKYINSYLETQAYTKWFNSEYNEKNGNIKNDFEGEIEEFEKEIEKLLESKENTIELLKIATPYDERRKFGLLGKYLTAAFPKLTSRRERSIANVDSDMIDDEEKNNVGWISSGITLYHTDSSDLILSRVIKLFSYVNQSPHASQILICSKETTFEDLNCFLYRCIYHDQDGLLYCLVQPENLKPTVTDEILKILFKILRNSTRAFFTVITADKRSKWFLLLQIYMDELELLTDTQREKFYKQYICTDFNLYQQKDNNNNDNPYCCVFLSDEECVGKSYEITKICNKNKFKMIHIPFNSPKIDKDFVVHRLTLPEVQRAQQRDEKIVFHLNVSSHAGKDINTLMFQLLILRHITKSSTGESFAVRPNHAFFIELPSQISKTYKRTNIDDVTNYFYFVAGRRSFIPQQKISMDLKRFEFTKEHQFVLKYLDALDRQLLEIKGTGNEQWDADKHPKINFDRAKALVDKYSNFDQIISSQQEQKQQSQSQQSQQQSQNNTNLKPTRHNNGERQIITIVYLRSFLDFLYRQFIQLTVCDVLIGQEAAVDVAGKWRKKRYIQYHTIIALSFARMAKYFACTKYEIANPLLLSNNSSSTANTMQPSPISSHHGNQRSILGGINYGHQQQMSMSQNPNKTKPKTHLIQDSVCNETDEEKIEINDDLSQNNIDIDEAIMEITDDEDEEKEKFHGFGRQNSEYNQRDETTGEETFSLVNEWQRADPPIVFLNANIIVQIEKPNLGNDLDFQRRNAEQSYTLLCSDLDECKHPDAEEWKLVQKIMLENMQSHGGHLKWDLYNFKQEDEIRKKNIQKGQLYADSKEKQKQKLRIILTLCGGYKKFNKSEQKWKPIRDEKARDKLVDKLYDANKDYALTFDNILKIVAIFFRIKSGIPVLIMGETGCGKTKLLEYMSHVLNLSMISVDVHGGYNIDDLSDDIKRASRKATDSKGSTILLFLDEINTSEEIASFKEIICDHCFKGEKLPDNLITIGALNPYRRRKKTKEQSENEFIDRQNNKTFYETDFERDMSKLVYTVYPLPPSMKYFVWNFGYIHPIDEKQYIAVITTNHWNELLFSEKNKVYQKKVKPIFDEFRPFFASLIDQSQQNLRLWMNEISICSLRDVQRANKFFKFFYKQFKKQWQKYPRNRLLHC